MKEHKRKMKFRMVGLLLLSSFVGCAAIPEGFILSISPQCAADVNSPATISVISDFSVDVEIACKDGYIMYVEPSIDGATYTGTVKYSGDSSSECIFKKLRNTAVYKVLVMMHYGAMGSPIQTYTDTYLVTCTYDDRAETETSTASVAESVIAPVEIQGHGGAAAVSTFNLDVTDVVGNTMTDNILLGKKIKLVAQMSDTIPTEVSAQAVSCTAIGDVHSYSILRGGCGDGVILNRYTGFTTSGRTISSPFFSAFHLRGSNTVQFECNFTVCSANCDGSSCAAVAPSRRRRSAEYRSDNKDQPHIKGENFVSVWTDSFFLSEKLDNPNRKHAAVITPLHNGKSSGVHAINKENGDGTRNEKKADRKSDGAVKSSVKHIGTTVGEVPAHKPRNKNRLEERPFLHTKQSIFLISGLTLLFLVIIWFAWFQKTKSKPPQKEPETVSVQQSVYI